MKVIKVNTTRIWGTVRITNGKKIVTPEYYDWEYCCKNRMAYIMVTPKIKYALINFDLFSIDKKLHFDEAHDFTDLCADFYDNYILKSGLPNDRIKFCGGGGLSRMFNVFKKDAPEIMEQLFQMIEKHIKKYGAI